MEQRVTFAGQPRWTDKGLRPPMISRQSDLKIYGNAVQRFARDVGSYPVCLHALAATEAPRYGQVGSKSVKIDPRRWKGPYVDCVPSDPVSGEPYVYDMVRAQILAPDGQTHCCW